MAIKTLIPLLFWFCALSGCQGRHGIHNSSKDHGTSGQQGAKDDPADITDLDTSMLSLTAGPRISINDLLSQDWNFEDVDPPHWNEYFWDSSADARIYPGIALFKDQSVTVNARSRIQMGKWALNKESRELSMQFSDGSSITYIIRQVSVRRMELIRSKGFFDIAKIKLSAGAIVHKRAEEDPFYSSNNWWRIRPGTSETPEQIRRRIKNCVHFFALYFLDNHHRQETDISFIGFPSCFIWYNGGIGIEKEADLEKKWKDCFYSETQAMEGYRLLEDILQSHTLKWPDHPTSWIQQTGEVLQQMADKL
jgi:hypothetical protein